MISKYYKHIFICSWLLSSLQVSANPGNPKDDYAFCATDSGDIVKLYLTDSYELASIKKVENEENERLRKGLPTGGRGGGGNIVQSKAANAKPPSAVVACAIRRVPKKSVMNAGKFSGGTIRQQLIILWWLWYMI